jgi:hypothetical protein
MKNAKSLYKLSKRNMVGMLKVDVQISYITKKKKMDQSPSEMIIHPKSLEKTQFKLGTKMKRHKMFY